MSAEVALAYYPEVASELSESGILKTDDNEEEEEQENEQVGLASVGHGPGQLLGS